MIAVHDVDLSIGATRDAGRNGFVASGTSTLTFNSPPASGGYTGKSTAVEVKALAGPNPSFKAGAPVALFDAHIAATSNAFNYDVTADGKRFLVAATPTGPATSTPFLTVRVNWNAGTKK